MSPCFKITYKTTQDYMYELTIPNAFDFDESIPENVTRINTAAKNILAANAIDTKLGELSSIQSIVFTENDLVASYDVSE